MKKKKTFMIVIAAVLLFAAVVSFVFLRHPALKARVFDLVKSKFEVQASLREKYGVPDYVDCLVIDLDGKSRDGTKLDSVRNIVVHYVGNPMSSAKNNRDYFNSPDSNVSSHFVIGLDGEIILCVPLDEKSAASNDRNIDTISIEVCHPDESGKFNDVTYRSLVKLCRFLIDKFSLSENDIIRHFDITGKICPKYYVENPEEWEKFLSDVATFQKND